MLLRISTAFTTAAKRRLLLAALLLSLSISLGHAEESATAHDTASIDPRLIEPIPEQTDARSREIIARHIEALGGQEALDAIQSFRVTEEGSSIFTLTQNSKNTTQEYKYNNIRTLSRPNFFLVRIIIPEGTEADIIINAFNGESCWVTIFSPDETTPPAHHELTGQQLLNAREGFFLDPCLDWEAKGYTFEYLGEEDSKGRTCHLLKLYFPSGQTRIYYVDVESYQFTRMTQKMLKFSNTGDAHKTSDTSQIEVVDTQYKDYKQFGGVWFPTRHISSMDDKHLGEVHISNIEINPDIAPDFFDPPTPQAPTDQPNQP